MDLRIVKSILSQRTTHHCPRGPFFAHQRCVVVCNSFPNRIRSHVDSENTSTRKKKKTTTQSTQNKTHHGGRYPHTRLTHHAAERRAVLQILDELVDTIQMATKQGLLLLLRPRHAAAAGRAGPASVPVGVTGPIME